MKAAQVGATEAGNNWIGFVIHHAPGPMLAVLPTVEMAKRTSRGLLDPLISESPVLRALVNPARSRDAGNSMLSKEFQGGILVLTGANSATGLRSMPARYIFLDEVDVYPASADEEGDPVALAEARTTTFSHRRKVFMVSTPTIRGISRIEREYEASDQRRYFVPCPHCGAMQWLQFERLRWDKGRPDTAASIVRGARSPSLSITRRRCWSGANGARRLCRPTRIPSASPLGWNSWQQITQIRKRARERNFARPILGLPVMGGTSQPDWPSNSPQPAKPRLRNHNRWHEAGARFGPRYHCPSG
jgi:phage terminase large subunit GpA-like protein